jgi:hypothetical protein
METTGITIHTVLGTELSRSIMEATGRFEFIKEESELKMLIFWDFHKEIEYSIQSDLTLEKLMKWITNLYSEDFLWRGEWKAQRKIRIALGLDPF